MTIVRVNLVLAFTGHSESFTAVREGRPGRLVHKDNRSGVKVAIYITVVSERIEANWGVFVGIDRVVGGRWWIVNVINGNFNGASGRCPVIVSDLVLHRCGPAKVVELRGKGDLTTVGINHVLTFARHGESFTTVREGRPAWRVNEDNRSGVEVAVYVIVVSEWIEVDRGVFIGVDDVVTSNGWIVNIVNGDFNCSGGRCPVIVSDLVLHRCGPAKVVEFRGKGDLTIVGVNPVLAFTGHSEGFTAVRERRPSGLVHEDNRSGVESAIYITVVSEWIEADCGVFWCRGSVVARNRGIIFFNNRNCADGDVASIFAIVHADVENTIRGIGVIAGI